MFRFLSYNPSDTHNQCQKYLRVWTAFLEHPTKYIKTNFAISIKNSHVFKWYSVFHFHQWMRHKSVSMWAALSTAKISIGQADMWWLTTIYVLNMNIRHHDHWNDSSWDRWDTKLYKLTLANIPRTYHVNWLFRFPNPTGARPGQIHELKSGWNRGRSRIWELWTVNAVWLHIIRSAWVVNTSITNLPTAAVGWTGRMKDLLEPELKIWCIPNVH